MSASVLVKHACQVTGEGPHWDDQSQTLLYVDIEPGDVHRYDPATNTDTKVNLDEWVTFVVPATKSGLVVGYKQTVSTFDLDTRETTVLASVEKGFNSRFNDAKCDPAGRLWAGTMGMRPTTVKSEMNIGSLYSMDSNHTIKPWDNSFCISNGLAWSMDSRTFYFVDSEPGIVYAYDYDNDTGAIRNRRECIRFPADKSLGFPDGMTIDTEGKLWIACFGPGKVIRFDPETAQQIQEVTVPGSQQITSCSFGGKNLDELYIVTANHDDKPWPHGPLGGSLYKATGLGVKGVPAVNFIG